jgi:hypothetical protein
VHGQIDADTLDEAARKLAGRNPGLTEVVWVADPMVPDLDDHAKRGQPIVDEPITAAPVVWRSLVRHFPLWLGIVVVHLSTHSRMVSIFAALTAIAYWTFVALPLVVFRRVQIEKSWHRWKQVMDSVTLLQRLNRIFPRMKVLAWAYDFEEARALSGLGRLDEALSRLAKHQGTTSVERARFAGQLVGLYEIAGRFELALGAAEEAAHGHPENPVGWLDVASVQVRRRRDTAAARAALARAEGHILSELTAAYRRLVVGLVAIEEGSPDAALAELDAAIQFFEGRNLSPGLIELCHLNRSLVLAQLRRLPEARSELARSRPMMLAAGEEELVFRVEAAVNEAAR